MGHVALLAVLAFAFLVMFRVIPKGKTGKWFVWVLLAILFVPMLFGILRTKALDFVSGGYPWWAYLVVFFGVLILLRLLVNFLFPWMRR